MNDRSFSPSDHFLIGLDNAIRTLFGQPKTTERPDPSQGIPEPELNEQERRLSGRLMRIDHTGEVCAQALYQGQALFARNPETAARLVRSAQEENDHLAWCQRRIEALGDRKSLLNPCWYLGAFAIGAAAGLAGDRWSLGFVVETERQVEAHLDSHLAALPERDEKSRAILEQMKIDEIHHAQVAQEAGAAPLPAPVKLAMKLGAKLMTSTVYWI